MLKNRHLSRNCQKQQAKKQDPEYVDREFRRSTINSSPNSGLAIVALHILKHEAMGHNADVTSAHMTKKTSQTPEETANSSFPTKLSALARGDDDQTAMAPLGQNPEIMQRGLQSVAQ